jgi:hypothetical protein
MLLFLFRFHLRRHDPDPFFLLIAPVTPDKQKAPGLGALRLHIRYGLVATQAVITRQ